MEKEIKDRLKFVCVGGVSGGSGPHCAGPAGADAEADPEGRGCHCGHAEVHAERPGRCSGKGPKTGIMRNVRLANISV